jgi:hypothetical protein
MKYIYLLILSLIMNCLVFSQDEPKASLNIEGQVAISTDGKGVFVNMGGPNIKFNFSKFIFAINMMPSLRFQQDKVKSFVTPILGFGPQLYLLKDKRFVLSFPSYYNAYTNKWIFTAGVGYILTKKKK